MPGEWGGNSLGNHARLTFSVPGTAAQGWLLSSPGFVWLSEEAWRPHLKPVLLSHALTQGEQPFHSGKQRGKTVSSRWPLSALKLADNLSQGFVRSSCSVDLAATWLCIASVTVPPPSSHQVFDKHLD